MTPPEDDLAGVDDLIAEVALGLLTDTYARSCLCELDIERCVYLIDDDRREHYAMRPVMSVN